MAGCYVPRNDKNTRPGKVKKLRVFVVQKNKVNHEDTKSRRFKEIRTKKQPSFPGLTRESYAAKRDYRVKPDNDGRFLFGF
ncbi:hypothetical protein JCM30760_20490 [Thiomicrorhabdus hydrogeniphila]